MAGESIVQREKMCYLNVYGGGAYGIWKKYYQPNIILKKKSKANYSEYVSEKTATPTVTNT